MEKLRNIAFIDGQNLTQNMRNAEKPWKLKGVKKTVSCLIKDNKFKAIMFPSKHSSSLYRELDQAYIVKLYHKNCRGVLELKK